MARHRTIQNSFNAGELTPKLWHRMDLEQYGQGCKLVENAYLFPHGGVTRRGGTHFVNATKDAEFFSRLVPFVFSQNQAYILEFGHGYIRFYRDEGQLVDGGGVPVEVATDYAEDELPSLDFAATGDILYITHPLHPVAKLSRLSDLEWTLTAVKFRPLPSYEDGLEGPGTLTLSAVTGLGVTATTSSDVFRKTSVDRQIVSGAGRAVITGYTSGTVVTVDILVDFPSVGPLDDYKLEGSPVANLGLSKSGPVGAKVDLTLLKDDPTGTNLVAEGTFPDLSSWTNYSPQVIATGTDSGPGNSPVLTDAGTDFRELGVRIGMFLSNTTDGSFGIVSGFNDNGEVVSVNPALSGGTDNDFDNGDSYSIKDTSTVSPIANAAMLNGGPAGTAWIEQGITTVAGNTYKLTFDVIDNPISAQVGSVAKKADVVGEASYTTGNKKEIVFKATTGTTYIQFRNNQNFQGGVTNVICRLYNSDGWLSQHVGDYIKAKSGVIEIISITSESKASGILHTELETIEDDLDTTVDVIANAGTWTLERPSWSNDLGWPAHVTFYQDRAVFGSTTEFPLNIWGSVTGDYENFAAGVANDQSFEYTLASETVEPIRWMVGASELLIGTGANEIKVSGGSTSPLTPTQIISGKPTSYGSANVRPVSLGTAILFVQKTARRVRALTFSIEADDLDAIDLQIFADHVAPAGFFQLAYQAEPNSIVWAVTNDGKLVSLTLVPDQKVRAWSRHPISGTVESVASIPIVLPDGSVQDQVWLIVSGTVDGAFRRYVCYLDDHNGRYGPLMVDLGLIYSGASTSAITGLDHLEGLTVAIQGNGAAYPNKVVLDGQITGLSPEVTYAEVGLPFTPQISLLRPTLNGIPLGGLNGSVDNTFVAFLDTLGCRVNGTDLDFRTPQMNMDEPPEVFTGDKPIDSFEWDPEMSLVLSQPQPLPWTVLAVTRTVNANIP